MIKVQEFTFASASDQLMLAGVALIPDAPKGMIQFVHGMAEYKERYLPVMNYLAAQGYLCVMHDHRGHGKSVKREADLGYFYGSHATYLVEDIHQLSVYMKQAYPTLPLFLFGHSMGSLLVRAYIKRYDQDIDALIICGSPSQNPASRFALWLTKCIGKWKGEYYRSSLIQRLAFGSYAKKFLETGSENVWLCSDMDVVRAYDQDTMCGFTFTINGFENLFSLLLDVYDTHHWQVAQPSLPILFIAGSEDPCITSEAKFKQAQQLLRKQGYQHIQSKLYQGMRHEILNEKGKEKVYQDILSFYEEVRNTKK